MSDHDTTLTADVDVSESGDESFGDSPGPLVREFDENRGYTGTSIDRATDSRGAFEPAGSRARRAVRVFRADSSEIAAIGGTTVETPRAA